jgi:glycosyltransferase involved in cell wall biosynthesis
MPNLLLSIIIANYNYGRFLAESVSSALALEYEPKEIIAIDDGSTDDSWAILKRLAADHEIFRIFRKEKNEGQVSAFNFGFSQARGALIYTLDADDIVLPQMMTRVTRVWNDKISKVQFQLENTDDKLNPLGTVYPHFPPNYTADVVRKEFLANGGYISSGTSNVYSRRYLEKIYPFDATVFRNGDAALNSVAPLYGDVVSLSEPLGYYRRHGASQLGATSLNISALQHMVAECHASGEFVGKHCALVGHPFPQYFLNRERLQSRLVSRKLAPETHPVSGNERVYELTLKTLKALSADTNLRIIHRSVLLMWTLVFAMSPRPVARGIAKLRFSPKKSYLYKSVMRAMRN